MLLLERLLKRKLGVTPVSSSPVAVANAFRQLHVIGIVPDYERILPFGYCKVIEPGAIVIDIGAHEGLHLGTFAQLVGPNGLAIGFEPLPSFAAGLRTRFAAHANVEVRQLALSDKPGIATFYHVRNGAGESGLQHRTIYNTAAADIEEIKVEVDTLEQQCGNLNRVDFIKIDIEGAEINCLQGATVLLARHRPFISVEYGHPTYSGYGYTARSLFDFAAASGYLISDIFGNIIFDLSSWEAICDHAYWDFFLVPSEKREKWERSFAA